MTSASRSRFAEVVRAEPLDVGLACLLMGGEVEPDLDVEEGLAVLDRLAAKVRLKATDPTAAAEALRLTLKDFAGSATDFEDLRSSLLHHVLRRGRGLPILLSILWCEVAARLGVPAAPLDDGDRVVVCIGDPGGEHVVVEPFQGGRTITTYGAQVLPPVELLLRVLTNVRLLAAQQGQAIETVRTRLWATELSLLLPRHPVDLRRERGELRVRLGDHLGGARELEEYADLVEDIDQAQAATARRVARQARAQLN